MSARVFHVKHSEKRPPPPPLTPDQFRRETAIGAADLARLETFVALLQRWRRRINLVSAASLADVWRRHVLDSAQLLPLIPAGARRLCDLGSGAGFPGLVLAILGAPQVHLVESDGRKCAFLAEANREARAGAVIHHARAEALAPLGADVVTARALAPLPRLLPLAERHLGPGGVVLALKGRNVARELTESQKTWNMRATLIASRSDPSGVVLKVEGVSRRHGQ